mgnify:CR=1 FL=1
MTQGNDAWLDFNSAPEQRADLADDLAALRGALLDRLEAVLHYGFRATSPFGRRLFEPSTSVWPATIRHRFGFHPRR